MRLRQRIKLQRDDQTQDAQGHPVATWRTYRECWANVEDMPQSKEEEQHNKATAVADVVVTIRHPHERGDFPTARDRVVFTDGNCERTLNVEGVHRMDQVRRVVQLACVEVQDA